MLVSSCNPWRVRARVEGIYGEGLGLRVRVRNRVRVRESVGLRVKVRVKEGVLVMNTFPKRYSKGEIAGSVIS